MKTRNILPCLLALAAIAARAADKPAADPALTQAVEKINATGASLMPVSADAKEYRFTALNVAKDFSDAGLAPLASLADKIVSLDLARTKVTVKVPAGVQDGMTLRVAGQGSHGVAGGRPGDLYVILHVAEDKRFEREGHDLHAELRLSFPQAALGDNVTVDGLDEDYEIEVPAGTQPGAVLSVRGAGLPPLHGGRRGDLLVHVQVDVPKQLSAREVELIQELARAMGGDVPTGAGDSGSIFGNLFGKKKS